LAADATPAVSHAHNALDHENAGAATIALQCTHDMTLFWTILKTKAQITYVFFLGISLLKRCNLPLV